MTKKTLKKIGVMSAMFTIFATSTVFATNVNDLEVMKGILNLKTLVTAIIGAIGAIVLVKAIADFSQAFQDRDVASMKTAGLSIAGGLMMAFAGAILTFLGITS